MRLKSFNRANPEKHWDSFGRADYKGNQKTLGSLFKLAIENGYAPPKAEEGPDGEDETRELTQREKLIMLGTCAELWRDKDGRRLATIEAEGHRESFTIKSRAFREWITFTYGQRHFMKIGGKKYPSVPGSTALNEAISGLEAIAARGPEHPAPLRVGEHEGSIYLDLGTPDWSVVKISAAGWEVVPTSPVRFVRQKGSRPLPIPVHGGKVTELRVFLNAGSDDDFILMVSWLLACLRPTGPYPLMVVNGGHGSGKSVTCRTLRRLVDPNSVELRNVPKDDRDMMIAAKNNWILAIDNLSFVKNDFSETLCRIATGGGTGTRELYENDEECLLEACRPQLLNGIPPLLSRPDLADRAIVCTIPAMADSMRRTEEEFWPAFDAAAPRILGALLDGASGAMRLYSTVVIKKVSRMLDFAKWAEAGIRALGYAPGTFEAAYQDNRGGAEEDALDADPVATALIKFMGGKASFVGSAGALLESLEICHPGAARDRNWPKGARALSCHLRRLPELLRTRGLKLEFPKRSSGERPIVISTTALPGRG